MGNFHNFNLDTRVVQAVTELGFNEATPIQKEAIPIALRGKDMIGQAQTGTGKTGAFGIPLVNNIHIDQKEVQALILAPTRELANQVAGQLVTFGKYRGVRTVVVYGGQDMRRQIRELRRTPHVIVATPGRLMDHMRRRTVDLQHVNTVVLDEADEMLNMGFIDDIETILKEVPEKRQTLLFSATMPKRIERLAHQFMTDPAIIAVEAKELTLDHIEQRYIELNEREKFDALCRLLDIETPKLAIVFGRTKRRVDELTDALGKRGYDAEGIHGDLTQPRRDQVLRKFREGIVPILVATDVAARGLDISGVSHVYNFDLPQDPESYVHRIGRTGRAGNKGVATTFVTRQERSHLDAIERVVKKKMDQRRMPTKEDAMASQQREVVEQLRTLMVKDTSGVYRQQAALLLDDGDATDVVAAALQLLTKEPNTTPVRLTAEAPLRTRKQQGKGRRSRRRSRRDRRDRNRNRSRRHQRRSRHNN